MNWHFIRNINTWYNGVIMPAKNQKLTEEQKHQKESWWNSEEGMKLKEKWKLEAEEKYYKNPKICLECGKVIPYSLEVGEKRFCGRSCSARHNNKKRVENGYVGNNEKTSLTMKQKYIVGEIKIPNPYKHSKHLSVKCLECGNQFDSYVDRKRKFCCKKCSHDNRRRLFREGKLHLGGYNGKQYSHGKRGVYRGYSCDSSYELAFVIYHLENNIPFTRNTEGFDYKWGNKIRKYYPDFIINGEYIEIKGWMNERDKEKVKAFPKNIKVLYRKDMDYIFDYVIKKYGKDFIKLYDSNDK